MGVYRNLRAFVFISIFFISPQIFAQSNCDDLVLMDQGNQVFKNRVCAPVVFDWLVFCKRINGKTVQFVYDWGDGVEQTITPNYNAGTNQYEYTASHTYPDAAATMELCNYEAKVYIEIDGERCTDNPQEQTVIVWDIDDENGGEMRVEPELYRVCEGNDATISFTDNSKWNCVPPDVLQNLNQANRWTQWVYGTAGSTIADVEVNGGVQTYPYIDPANQVEYYPTPALTPSSQSLDVYVPNTATVGQQFNITLKNWNQCNPYDNDLSDTPTSPVSGDAINGDNAPISKEATILIVDRAKPDYQTKLNDVSGSVQSIFCIGDQIYFEDLTPTITGADFEYTWEFYDGNTDASTRLDTKDAKNTTFSYNTSGEKLIRLRVIDTESVGNCGGYIDKTVTIYPSAQAELTTTDASDNPIVPEFCQDATNSQSFDVKIHDATVGYDATAEWTWHFYEKNSTSTIESTHNGTTTTATFTKTYTDPGVYMVELISSNVGINCDTRDTLYIKVFSDPEADFTADLVCEDESTTFTSTSGIPTVVDGDSILTYAWDFDYDGVTFNPDATYNNDDPFTYQLGTSGTYPVALQVTTAKGGCSNLIVKDVEVKPTPYTSFTAGPVEGCPDLEVNFAIDTLLADQPVGITKYFWHITDHFTGNVTSYEVDPPQDSFTAPPFTYDRTDNQLHTYGVQLEAITANGCDRISEPDTITVYPNPGSGFVIVNLSSADKNCSPRDYHFRANKGTRDLSPDSYHWVIEDKDNNIVVDTTIAGTEPNFTYVLTNDEILVKSFTVTLQPSKTAMCIQPSTHTVNVNPIPSADFTITETYSDCSVVTYFVEAEQKSIVYDWNVSVPTINTPDLTEDRMELTFARQPGTTQNIDIQLVTTNVAGCQSIPAIENLSISEKEDINASFTIDPVKQKIPNSTVNITNNTTPGSWAYLWEFGDGATSTAVNPSSHTYDSYGDYPIKLTVSGSDCSESDSITAIIEPTLPVVDFTYSQVEGCLPVIVSFTNLSEYGNPDTYFWDFGDGKTSTEENPTHIYRENGVYTVTLQASNILGVLITTEKQVVVDLENGPVADFNIQKATKFLPDEPVFLSNYSQNASSYWWDFGDGATSTQLEPQHIYRNSGDYDISLIAYNENGCTDTITSTITILPIEPVVDFEITPTSGCRPLKVHFTNLSRYAEPDSYYWTFGQGQGVSTEVNPTYTYYEPGIYTVTLRASNSAGVSMEERKEFSIEVYDNPTAGFSIRPEEVFLPQPIFLANLSRGATTYQWHFGDGNSSTEFEPQHEYKEAGSYDVTLIAENEYGCTDTLRQENAVYVEKGGNINIPNAFTPSLEGPGASEVISGNSYNDVFLPVFEGVTDFHMLIYNRWGELLFESKDKSFGWDGYFKGKLSAKDVYVYKLNLKFSDGRRETIAGDVTLLR